MNRRLQRRLERISSYCIGALVVVVWIVTTIVAAETPKPKDAHQSGLVTSAPAPAKDTSVTPLPASMSTAELKAKPFAEAVQAPPQESIAKPAPPPVIPEKLEILYFRAALESVTAARAADQAFEREKAVSKEVQTACGSAFTPTEQMRPDGKPAGRLICAPLPAPPAPPAK